MLTPFTVFQHVYTVTFCAIFRSILRREIQSETIITMHVHSSTCPKPASDFMAVSEAMDLPTSHGSFLAGTSQQITPEPLSEPLLPEPETKSKIRWKCYSCYAIIDDPDLIDGKKCPDCGESFLETMCKHDHICTCANEISSGIRYCPECGQPICPCGSHSVATVSRVTGYLSEIGGWNNAKKQELKDRVRYSPSHIT